MRTSQADRIWQLERLTTMGTPGVCLSKGLASDISYRPSRLRKQSGGDVGYWRGQ
nr:hypothetical protein [Rubripirellula reticaptiva]